MDFQDYYQTLGVPRTASQADIKTMRQRPVIGFGGFDFFAITHSAVGPK